MASQGRGTTPTDPDDLFAGYEPRAGATLDAYDDEVDRADGLATPPSSTTGTRREQTGGSQVPVGSSDTSRLSQWIADILEDEGREDVEDEEEPQGDKQEENSPGTNSDQKDKEDAPDSPQPPSMSRSDNQVIMAQVLVGVLAELKDMRQARDEERKGGEQAGQSKKKLLKFPQGKTTDKLPPAKDWQE